MKFNTANVLPVALLVSQANAWGEIGHWSVGQVAQSWLGPNALRFVRDTLGPENNYSLAAVASWADQVRKTAKEQYDWSTKLHFIEVRDSAVTGKCNVVKDRDCADGRCSVTAIANYTERLIDTTLDATQTQEALKFMTHFYGDIGQPLHNENMSVGGNWIPSICDGKVVSLHSAWDDSFINKYVKENYSGSKENYAAGLIAEMENGIYTPFLSSWVNCTDSFGIRSSRLRASKAGSQEQEIIVRDDEPVDLTKCPLIWSAEANAHVCAIVFDYNLKQDLCRSPYYSKAIETINLQIAKQGYRLAATLNSIFDA